MNGNTDVALGRFGRVDELAGLELDEGDVVAEPACRASEQVGAGERGDERIGRPVDELVGSCELAQASVDDHADLVGERGCVLEVVGDEDGRERELLQQLL